MKALRKYSALAIVAVMLTACGGTSGTVTQTTVIEKQTVDANLPSALRLQNVTWGTTEDPVAKDGSHLMTLTIPEYNKLSGNIVETQRYIKQLKQTVKYYRTKQVPADKK